MAAIRRGANKVTPAFSMEGEGAEFSPSSLEIVEENKKKKWRPGMNKLAVFTICMMMVVALGHVGGAMGAGEESPAPSVESTAITYLVPVLMAAFASLAAFFF
ncbi:hypothetical protein CQW23_04183 [Capsicum baccatum]|uniref:Uncharacterized protein n=1 Tax=Capsicum baccatum TaxID=33114 RepID=A0A2G2XDZ0_CAPBA|nr:hypothetical protein CQW23_04183 [Capsicum baccatum]